MGESMTGSALQVLCLNLTFWKERQPETTMLERLSEGLRLQQTQGKGAPMPRPRDNRDIAPMAFDKSPGQA